MAPYKELVLKLSDIQIEDKTYQITTKSSISSLSDAILNVGLIHPPLVYPKNSNYGIISGFRRIAACRMLKFESIPARAVSHGTSPLECAKIAITENACQRSLNAVELSRALNLLANFIESERALSETTQTLGLAESSIYIKKLMKICRMSTKTQQGILTKRISLNMAIDIEQHEASVSNLLATLFMKLGLSQGKQREMYANLKEIALRENLTIQQVLASEEVEKILWNNNIDNLQKTNKIRSRLYRRRYPNIYKTKENFNTAVKALKLGKNIAISPSDYFESSSYRLKMSFQSEDELKELVKELSRALKNPHIKKLFRIT